MHLKTSAKRRPFCIGHNVLSICLQWVRIFRWIKLFFFSGYQCESFNNPPDFFLDLINGDLESTRSMSIGECGSLILISVFHVQKKWIPVCKQRVFCESIESCVVWQSSLVEWYRLLSARLWYLQCVSCGDTTFLDWYDIACRIWITTLFYSKNAFPLSILPRFFLIHIFIKNVVAVAAYSRLASRSQAKFHTKKLSPLVRPCAAAPAQSTTSPPSFTSIFASLVNGRESNHSLNQWPSQALSKTKKED